MILDEKIAVFDTVDAVLNRMAEYLKKLNGRQSDYPVVQHTVGLKRDCRWNEI